MSSLMGYEFIYPVTTWNRSLYPLRGYSYNPLISFVISTHSRDMLRPILHQYPVINFTPLAQECGYHISDAHPRGGPGVHYVKCQDVMSSDYVK